MTITVKNIIPRKLAESTQTGQYTATGCKTIIDKFTATNTTGANVTFSVNLVPSGGAADATNKVLSSKTIAPGECYQCPELVGQTLEDGGFISTLVGTVSALVISASGREIT